MTPQPQLQFDVFVSYSREDEYSVLAVQEALERQGIHAWRDKPKISPGESFIEKIGAGLSQSRCVLLFNSQNALASTWVQREWNVALTLRMPIIPVRLDDSELPLMLRPVEFVDLRDFSKLEVAARQIFESVRGLVARPVSPESSSNPSVLGRDVVVIERMIANQQRTGRRLDAARWTAVVVGVAMAAPVVIFRSGDLALGIAAAGGSLAIAGAMVWVITAHLGLSQYEMKRLNGIKDGIELYCPHQPACSDFRIQLETTLKKLAGIGETA